MTARRGGSDNIRWRIIAFRMACADREAVEEPSRLIARPALARTFCAARLGRAQGARRAISAPSRRVGRIGACAGAGGARRGCQRAGLVTLALPASGCCGGGRVDPEAMVCCCRQRAGALGARRWPSGGGDFSRFDGVVAGRAWARRQRARGVVAHLLWHGAGAGCCWMPTR
jgi:hypothetical protein